VGSTPAAHHFKIRVHFENIEWNQGLSGKSRFPLGLGMSSENGGQITVQPEQEPEQATGYLKKLPVCCLDILTTVVEF
jgi:hypothetical protein